MRLFRASSILSALSFGFVSFAQAEAPVERPEDKWDLSGVYADVAAWEGEVAKTETAVDGLTTCAGTLATQLRACLDRRFEAQKAVGRVVTWASNQSNADTRDATWEARSQRAELLVTRYSERVSWFEPEILGMGAAAVEAQIAADVGLKPYDHYLRGTLRDQAHTLDAEREALLAASGTVRDSPERTHGMLVNADLPWPSITLSDGTKTDLSPSAYTNFRGASSRADRKIVFDAFFGALKTYEGTLGSTLDGAVQGHWMMARARHYDTSLAASIDADHVPPAVVQTLIARTNHNLPTLHRYLKLRASMLGVTDLAYSDMYPALVEGERHYTVDEAKTLTLAAVAPLGKEYVAGMKAGFGGRWMDVYPRPGKRGGAYMDGAAYDVHPFVLLNYNGDYESVSTFAHEWGHAMHSVLSARAQPYAKADYSTFLAEIASTCNEALLLQHMLKSAKNDDERLYYLGSALENLRTTYFRQAQFAEFEVAIHTKVEQGEPLTGASLSTSYLEILKRYYGAAAGVTRIDDLYAIEWSYIPHFYYNFYVYQYATSIAAASLFSEDILAGKKGAVERYLGLLKSGASDDPYVLLKNAGVDMATPAPYDALAHRMDAIMDQMEAIRARKK